MPFPRPIRIEDELHRGLLSRALSKTISETGPERSVNVEQAIEQEE